MRSHAILSNMHFPGPNVNKSTAAGIEFFSGAGEKKMYLFRCPRNENFTVQDTSHQFLLN